MDKAKLGYKDIDKSEKPDKVNNIFTSVSDRYDLMNDFMSFGLHRIWKMQFIKLCNVQSKRKVLDVACGTGDISISLHKENQNIDLTCLDPNPDMIEICKQKFINKGHVDINYQIHGIENFLPKKQTFDLITVAFGFRNFTDHKKALENIFKLLEPGGMFLIMDFKKPRGKLYSKLFKFYTLNIIPKIGKIVADDENSYRYLAESIQTYFSPNEIKDMLSKAGFDNTKVVNLLEDVATIHIGQKL
jgi:demethylmenaquinone methyltransferase/2-methoxy-6-polyprenyl-1,4-benzoquinol methylase